MRINFIWSTYRSWTFRVEPVDGKDRDIRSFRHCTNPRTVFTITTLLPIKLAVERPRP